MLNNLGKDQYRAMSRYEFKYLLRPELAERVIQFLEPYPSEHLDSNHFIA